MTKTYTKGDYKRLSDRIRKDPEHVSADDYEMLHALRLTYKEPMATVFNTVERMAHSIDPDCICTYRIKRFESIISKLCRFPDMEVQRAADLAGCRCIMTRLDQVLELYDRIKKNEHLLPFAIKGKPNNYIENPKEDGYRSIHLNVQMKDESKKVVEIQLRCIEMHNWATLVEISDVIFQAKLKEYGSKVNPDLFRLHQLLSKKDDDLTTSDYLEIAQISKKYRYMERVGGIFSTNGIEMRQQWNKMKLKNKRFFLISTGSDGKPEFAAFENFDEAERNYFEWFTNNEKNSNIVLTRLRHTDFNKISIAYCNYFLTYNTSMLRILKAVAMSTVDVYNRHKLAEFRSAYPLFWKIVYIWLGDKIKEIDYFNNDKDVRKSFKKRSEWTVSIQNSFRDVNSIIKTMQSSFNHGWTYFFLHRFKKRVDRAANKKLHKMQSVS